MITLPSRLLVLPTPPVAPVKPRNSFQHVAVCFDESASHHLLELRRLLASDTHALADPTRPPRSDAPFDAYQLLVLKQLIPGTDPESERDAQNLALSSSQLQLLARYIAYHQHQLLIARTDGQDLYQHYPICWLLESLRILMDALQRKTIVQTWNSATHPFLIWTDSCKRS